MKKNLICVFLSLVPIGLFSQNLSALDIIEKSIHYHDPENQLYEKDLSFFLEESRPRVNDALKMVRLAPKYEHFQIESQEANQYVLCDFKKSEVRYYLDGVEVLDKSNMRKVELREEQSYRKKNYYLYIWHLPIKLRDPGTLIDSGVHTEVFNSVDCYKIGVRYAGEEVRKDFYFNKRNFALVGYRFFNNAEKNDGEYIYLEGEYVFDLIRLPKIRKWYSHKADEYLGTDRLIRMEENEKLDH